MDYKDQMKSPKWQKKRLEILNRDEFKCKLCGETELQLHVHHKKYTGNPILEPDENLITLCNVCHSIISIFDNRHLQNSIFVRKNSRDDIHYRNFFIDDTVYNYLVENNVVFPTTAASFDSVLDMSKIIKKLRNEL